MGTLLFILLVITYNYHIIGPLIMHYTLACRKMGSTNAAHFLIYLYFNGNYMFPFPAVQHIPSPSLGLFIHTPHLNYAYTLCIVLPNLIPTSIANSLFHPAKMANARTQKTQLTRNFSYTHTQKVPPTKKYPKTNNTQYLFFSLFSPCEREKPLNNYNTICFKLYILYII